VYHLFPVRARHRTAFQTALAARGVDTLVHYPMPIPRQQAFAHPAPAACPIADRVCEEICSLPLHPFLTDEDADRVAAAVRHAVADLPVEDTAG
jgi:dTDP-3-amino-3,4,6-trideoxy-alpha-D-glucose transaminase